MKKVRRGDSGAAMILVAVVMLVLTMLCLSLLLTAFSFFQTAGKKTEIFQTREMAVSISSVIKEELAGVDFTSPDEEQLAVENNEHALWFFLRNNMLTDKWPKPQKGEESEKRYFSLEELDKTGCDDVTVQMYYSLQENVNSNEEDIRLYVTVTCKRGTNTAAVTSVYQLNAEAYGNQDGGDKWKWSFLYMD